MNRDQETAHRLEERLESFWDMRMPVDNLVWSLRERIYDGKDTCEDYPEMSTQEVREKASAAVLQCISAATELLGELLELEKRMP